jgi:hypothetical protein
VNVRKFLYRLQRESVVDSKHATWSSPQVFCPVDPCEVYDGPTADIYRQTAVSERHSIVPRQCDADVVCSARNARQKTEISNRMAPRNAAVNYRHEAFILSLRYRILTDTDDGAARACR